jgi:hypothetical protein
MLFVTLLWLNNRFAYQARAYLLADTVCGGLSVPRGQYLHLGFGYDAYQQMVEEEGLDAYIYKAN